MRNPDNIPEERFSGPKEHCSGLDSHPQRIGASRCAARSKDLRARSGDALLLVALTLAACTANDETPLTRSGETSGVQAERADGADEAERADGADEEVASRSAEIERRLLAASARGELPRPIDEDGARRLVAAMRSLGAAQSSLRAGKLDRAALDAERAHTESICQEIVGLGCDALFFSPMKTHERRLP